MIVNTGPPMRLLSQVTVMVIFYVTFDSEFTVL